MTVEIQGPDGEWTEVPGVASVDIEPSQPPAHPAAPTVRAFLDGLRPLVQAAHEAMATLARQLRAALPDAEPSPPARRPDRRPDRPAWQSPYGPPTRRRR